MYTDYTISKSDLRYRKKIPDETCEALHTTTNPLVVFK